MSEEANTLQTRLRDLKAAAYDELAVVQHHQNQLQNINSEIRKVDSALVELLKKENEIVTGAGDQV